MENRPNFNSILTDAIKRYEKQYQSQKWFNFLNKKKIKKAIKCLERKIYDNDTGL